MLLRYSKLQAGFLIAFVWMAGVQAQQNTFFNTSYFNPMLENPALTGNFDHSQAFIHYRNQWVGFEGSPESTLASIDYGFNDRKNGVGLMVCSDRTNILGSTTVLAGYSHRVFFSGEHNLRLGLNAGITHNTIYFNKIKAEYQNETTLFNYFESASGFDANVGLAYSYEKAELQLVATHITNPGLIYKNEVENKELHYQYNLGYMAGLSYTFEFSDFKIKPVAKMRGIHGMPFLAEVEAHAAYQDKYFLNLAYRNKNMLALGTGFLVYDRFLISYNVNLSVGEFQKKNYGSHEICIGVRFNKSGGGGSTVVNNNYANSEELDNMLEQTRKQYKENKELKRRTDSIQKNANRMLQEIEQQKRELKSEQEEIERLRIILEDQRGNYIAARDQEQTLLDDIDEDELWKYYGRPVHYVLGVFDNIRQAKDFQQVLIREEELYTKVLRSVTTGKYMVMVKREFTTLEEVKQTLWELNDLSLYYLNEQMWLYIK
ncbi:MAG: PorP/SprF family type IX secretion system membrane protein [Bacteroidales bacterium]|nr:PorP/SprF family type IX secretion system membrane protein [Bacteroidales bacterium]